MEQTELQRLSAKRDWVKYKSLRFTDMRGSDEVEIAGLFFLAEAVLIALLIAINIAPFGAVSLGLLGSIAALSGAMFVTAYIQRSFEFRREYHSYFYS